MNFSQKDNYSRLRPSYTESDRSDLQLKFSESRSGSLTSLSPSIIQEDSQTTPTSFSCESGTPIRQLSRMTSCRLSAADLSETSSTRAATPPVNSVNVSLNREICSQSTSCAQLINLAVSKGHIFNAVNWATCLHRMAKLFPTEAKNHRSTVARFLSQAHEVLMSVSEGSKFQPQHLATLLWAMAKLSIIDPGFVDDLVRRSMEVCDSLKAQDMANIAWSLAKMGIVHQSMFSLICDRISNRRGIINQFKPMEIASTTWAFGTVGAKGMGVADISPVIESLVSECLSRDLCEFSPQALANVLWALAKLQYPQERIFKVFGDHIVSSQRLREFKPQEIANVVWSMQSVRLVHHRLYAEIVQGRSINWAVFDPHALATVCGAMMELVDLNFALIISSRVLSSKLKAGYSISHCGVLLCEISAHLSHPTVATAASMLTEKLLSDITYGTPVDIHAVRGLIATLADSPKVMDQLSRCVLVESEYGIASQLTNAVFVLRKVSSAPELCKKIIFLAKSIGFSSANISVMSGLVGEAQRLGIMDDSLIAGCESVLSTCDLMNTMGCQVDELVPLLSAVVEGTPSPRLVTVGRLVAAACIERIKDAPVGLVGDLVMAANRLDFASPSTGGRADEVSLAVTAAAVADCMFGRPFDYHGEAFSKVLYGASEFVSRHKGTVSVEAHVKALCQLGVSLGATQGYSAAFSLAGLARLLASAFSLELDSVYKSVISACQSQGTILSQCMQSGPGGLGLLRESLDSFSLFCKVVSGYVMASALPGAWVQPCVALTEKDRNDPFSIEGALSLSVALGHVGAVDAQKDVIGHWVLPLMGVNEPSMAAPNVLGAIMASPHLTGNQRGRLESFSGLLSHFDLNVSGGGGLSNFDLPQ
jgi:hypothetical protein